MVPGFVSFWWARTRHRMFCRKTMWCPGHRYTDYGSTYPAYERQFGRLRRYYDPGSVYGRTGYRRYR